ncbi:EF-hand domain (C-terminal) containing [Perkinsus chesapeaki]|uniref:EF-hand domain (C-terminal) containing n=1 Tax=Perkinsus chesapeaki TaxID=330153 RepID=A0A7J6M6Y9_PERCH|nr:EF-hand domain (C-terminal) containing [Perkinsus chesapeaki]
MDSHDNEPASVKQSKGRYRSRRSRKRQESQGTEQEEEPANSGDELAVDDAVQGEAPSLWQAVADEPETVTVEPGDQGKTVTDDEVADDSEKAKSDPEESRELRVHIEGLVPRDFHVKSEDDDDDEVIELHSDVVDRKEPAGAPTDREGEATKLLATEHAIYGAFKDDIFPRTEPGHEPFDLKCPVCGHSGSSVVTHERSCGTYICMAILLVLFFPLCWLPLCCESCQEATHRCEHCEAFVGEQVFITKLRRRVTISIRLGGLTMVPKAPEGWRDGDTIPRSTTRDVFVAPNGATETEQLPAWDALDRHVLRYFGYYKEGVVESNLENYRIRPCTLYYYLEDDTMHVSEPREDNSGLSQGKLLKRHRIPRGDGSGYITTADMRIGEGIKIYGRVIQITAVDGFTRSYYENVLATPLADNLEIPEDTFAHTKKEAKVAGAAMARNYEKVYREVMLGGGQANERMQQFLEKDRKVCRFYAVMDDLSTEQYERRPFTIFYFLSDDTIEIREQYPLNCGRDNFPIFFKRGRVAKDSMPVLGPSDPLPSPGSYYKAEDLYVGQTIRLLNNDLFIYDADAFTREYFKTIGIELAPKRDVRLPEKIVPRPPTPPYTGYGSWDDSMGSVLNLVPKVPKKDMQKLMLNEGKILRFLAVFSNPEPEDVNRRFVFNYHLFDDTLSIHEPPQRNLGIVTGKFLEKGVHLNEATGRLVNPLDLVPGKTVVVFNHSFVITGCDHYTCKYFAKTYPDIEMKAVDEEGMDISSSLVPDEESDLRAILAKLREALLQQFPLVRDVFRRFDRDHNGVLTLAEIREVLFKFGFQLTEADALAIMRAFDTNKDGHISYNEFCDAILEPDYKGYEGEAQPKAPSIVKEDKGYAAAAACRSLEAAETAKVRRSVREVGDVFYKHPTMSHRLIKELSRVSNNQRTDTNQIRLALLRLGFPFDQDDIDRCVCFVMTPDNNEHLDLCQVKFVDFVKAVVASYHDLNAPR